MSPAITGTLGVSNWSLDLNLKPGPEWRSFEQFRVGGPAALDQIVPAAVGVLHVKGNTYNILRGDDFQKLLGLAAEVHRLKQGITLVVTAAKMVGKYPNDPTGIEMLYRAASVLRESSMLPEKDGHDAFQISEEECKEHGEEGDELKASDIPRPIL